MNLERPDDQLDVGRRPVRRPRPECVIERDPGVELLDEMHEIVAHRWNRLTRRVPDRLRERSARPHRRRERPDRVGEPLFDDDGRHRARPPAPEFPDDPGTHDCDQHPRHTGNDPPDERRRSEQEHIVPA
jgi:hypothetical protein